MVREAPPYMVRCRGNAGTETGWGEKWVNRAWEKR